MGNLKPFKRCWNTAAPCTEFPAGLFMELLVEYSGFTVFWIPGDVYQ